ncbi:MAG TPA: NfeD family protein [Clostridiales bacterium]|nr:NfeD family protein [Clostridiales bacterium]
MWPFWLIIAGLCLVIEIYTVGFFIFWFGIGALFALLVSFLTSNLFIQIVVFLVSSSLLVILTKPLMKKFTKNEKTVPTNFFSLSGKQGIVTKKIDSDNSTGQVKVKGELWSAISDKDIEKDAKVKILGVDGVKLKVEKIDE